MSVLEKKRQFSNILTNLIGYNIEITHVYAQQGGCINKAAILESKSDTFFVKWNYSTCREMFEKEIDGLKVIRSTNQFKIPNILGIVDFQDETFLFLENIYSKKSKDSFWEDFGTKLAKLHKYSNVKFGLNYDNYIGSLIQKNSFHDDWNTFFYENRLLYQIELAFSSNKFEKSILFHFENLYKRLSELIPVESPSLLHGDLWGGNVLIDSDGNTCLIDPAIYYGHREMELAYTTLFDKNPSKFYSAYSNEFPLEKGFQQRIEIYNLYPLLVHVNLFGGGYIDSVKKIIKKY